MHISPTLIGIGSPIVDAIALVDESFLAQIDGDKGGMVLVDAPTITSLIASLPKAGIATPGGSAGNTLFALARMGASTSFLGKIGNCAEGTYYRDSFSKLGAHGAFPIGSDEGETAAIGHFADFEARGIAAELGKAVSVVSAFGAVANLA